MMRLRMKLLQSKMNHYCKEINISTIKEFLKYQRAPSKLAFRAARCLCLLLNSFYHFPQSKDCLFNTWSEIVSFFNLRFQYLIQDLENLKTKCELAKPNVNLFMIDILKREVLLSKDNDLLEDHTVSPRVKNLVYKPIFCYTFFLLSYFNLKASRSLTQSVSPFPNNS